MPPRKNAGVPASNQTLLKHVEDLVRFVNGVQDDDNEPGAAASLANHDVRLAVIEQRLNTYRRGIRWLFTLLGGVATMLIGNWLWKLTL